MSLLNRLFSSAGEDSPAGNGGGIRLVLGLGNPGPEYEGTRHNVGFALLDRLAAQRDLKWDRNRKMRAKVASTGDGAVFAKPLTFMNLSGNAAARLARFHKLRPEQILVVHDDVDLPVGRIRFRANGSAGGHNGIKSVVEYLATEAFPRLKIGVGASDGGGDRMIDHVLGRFSEEESQEMEKVLAIAADGVNCALSSGLDAAMNEFNRRREEPGTGE
ncbi:MAG: aminoacyl-tRNA hydrolase [Verrucomicrobiales bacterium]